MAATFAFLMTHGYLVVFAWVLAGQAGLPVPAIPVLLAAGAMAGAGRLSLAAVAALSVAASLLSDGLWFLLGRRRGARVLGLLCRLSLEPDSCVRNTEAVFARRGALTLVLGKFVPGLATMAPPLAGMFGMSWPRFLLVDGLGALVWTLALVLPGYLFSAQLEQVAESLALTGAWLLGLLLTVVAAFVLIRFVRRQAFLRQLRVARITPAELQERLQAEAPPFVVDLRHGIDFATEPRVVPGAVHFAAEEIETWHGRIPRDRDVVLYCT